LSRDKEFRLTSNPAAQINPEIFENKVVWQDGRNGNWDIYMADLEFFVAHDAQPNPQEVHNAVNISATVFSPEAITEVQINITDPHGLTIGNFSMNYDSANDEFYYFSTYPTLGKYNYIIWAKVLGNNITSSSGFFIIRDTAEPRISNLGFPSNQEIFGEVNVSAEITDNYDLSSVWINITRPDTSWINITMDSISATEFYHNDLYDILGTYRFTIWANDTSNNWDSYRGEFDIQDATKPLISNLNISPHVQDEHGFVNVSADVRDNYNLYPVVFINITNPNGISHNETMMIHGNNYYFGQFYHSIGRYDFVIWANDTSNNWASETSSFMIEDSTAPIILIAEIEPPTQEVYDRVNISANVTDNYDLNHEVYINITGPDRSWKNETMDKSGSNYHLNRSFDRVGTYVFTIWSNDTNGNWAYAGGSFMMIDTKRPEIGALTITPSIQEVHGYVNVSVDTLDNYELYPFVRINLNRPDGSSKNITMSGISGIHFLNLSHDKVGVYSFTIWTKDTSNNWNFSVGEFEIVDTTKPEIDTITVVPSQPAQDDYVTISASVKDNYLLSEARILIARPNGLVSNFSMDYDYTYNRYYFIGSFRTAGIYDFTILAVDNSNNWNSSSGQFRIWDSTPPRIHVVSSVGSSPINESITISVFIRDNVAINKVRIYYTDTDGVARTGIMSLVEGIYTFTIPGQASEGTLTYYIWANDTAGNIVKSSKFEVEIPQEDEDNDNLLPIDVIVVASLVFLIPIIVFIVFILLMRRKREI
jgi:beta propeller repeat protein